MVHVFLLIFMFGAILNDLSFISCLQFTFFSSEKESKIPRTIELFDRQTLIFS